MISEERVEEVYKLVKTAAKKYKIMSEQEVQDLVWDVWQVLDKHYDESKSKLSTYVFLVCKHKILNYERDKKELLSLHEPVSETAELQDLIASDCDSPLDKLLMEEDIDIFHELYKNSSQLLQDYFEGAKQTELADKYNVSQAEISRRIKKELRDIRREYEAILER